MLVVESAASTVILCCWAILVIVLVGFHEANGCLKEERNALLHLKAVFNYPDGSSLPTWDDAKNGDCCAWESVQCDNATSRVIKLFLNGKRRLDSVIYPNREFSSWNLNASLFLPFEELISLKLSGNYFQGWTEPEGFKILSDLKNLELLELSSNLFRNLTYLGAISSLKSLDLNNNKLKGSFPTEEFAKLTKLEVLDLGDNGLSGSIAPSIGSMTFLKTFHLQYNDLTGSIKGLCKLQSLQELDLTSNSFDGNIPSCLSNLSSLRLLDLSNNYLEGIIPSFLIPSLTSLEYLTLSYNRFEGLISFGSFANHSKLEVFEIMSSNKQLEIETESPPNWVPTFQLKILRLSNCTINKGHGVIPSFLSTQYESRVVELSNTGLKGNLPSWLIEQNKRLEELSLVNNLFEGPLLLSSLHHSANMYKLDISVNKIHGELPSDIGVIFPKLGTLSAAENDLRGNIPHSIGQMSELQLLDLSNNNFSGELPEKLFIGCVSLVALKLSSNSFQGKIFPRKSNLTNLSYLLLDDNNFVGGIGHGLSNSFMIEKLDISNNFISERIPNWIGNLSSLESLAMSGNSFKGTLSDSFCKMKELIFLDLSRNNLSGTLPSCLHLSSLKYIHLQGNEFIGSVPRGLSKSTSLVTLHMRHNDFSGNIPSWFTALSKLRILLLKGNHLRGPIPDQLCQLKKISIMDLSHYNLHGSIPSCLSNISFGKLRVKYDEVEYGNEWGDNQPLSTYQYGNRLDAIVTDSNWDIQEEVEFITKYRSELYKGDILVFMSGMDLSCNKLTGQIPPGIARLSEIHTLNLSHNFLTGSIPETFSNLEQIESMDLSYNELSGSIPPQLTELNFLAIFKVSYNKLSGMIPDGKAQFGTFGETSYEGNSLLCGAPLNRSCATTRKPSVEHLNSNTGDDDTDGLADFYLSFTVFYILGLWGFFALVYLVPLGEECVFIS